MTTEADRILRARAGYKRSNSERDKKAVARRQAEQDEASREEVRELISRILKVLKQRDYKDMELVTANIAAGIFGSMKRDQYAALKLGRRTYEWKDTEATSTYWLLSDGRLASDGPLRGVEQDGLGAMGSESLARYRQMLTKKLQELEH